MAASLRRRSPRPRSKSNADDADEEGDRTRRCRGRCITLSYSVRLDLAPIRIWGIKLENFLEGQDRGSGNSTQLLPKKGAFFQKRQSNLPLTISVDPFSNFYLGDPSRTVNRFSGNAAFLTSLDPSVV